MEGNNGTLPVFILDVHYLKRSKYVMMLILSFVDFSFKVNAKILN